MFAAVSEMYDRRRSSLLSRPQSYTEKKTNMDKHFGNSGLFKIHSYHCNGSQGSDIVAWELKNLALNTKEFLICPKNYSEYLL